MIVAFEVMFQFLGMFHHFLGKFFEPGMFKVFGGLVEVLEAILAMTMMLIVTPMPMMKFVLVFFFFNEVSFTHFSGVNRMLLSFKLPLVQKLIVF